MLDIKIFINSDNIRNIVSKYAVHILNYCIKNMEFDTSLIEFLYIADDANFGETITTLQKSLGLKPSYTNNEFFSAAAKVIVDRNRNPNINFVVINAMHFLPISINQNGELYYDNEKAELDFYIIQHELAHCIDNLERSSKKDQADMQLYYSNMAIVQSSIVEDEACACFLSGKALTQRLFNNEIIEAKSAYDNLTTSFNNYKKSHGRDDSKLFDLASQVTNGVWGIIIQYSKLIAGRAGNSSLSKVKIPYPLGRYWKVGPLAFNRLEQTIQHMLIDYPTNVSNYRIELKDIWYNIALSIGFKLDEIEGKTSIYFDL